MNILNYTLLFPGMLNRSRGGMPLLPIPKQVKIILLTLLMSLPLLCYNNIIACGFFIIFTVIAFNIGWGSYIDLGENDQEYKDKTEVKWIDWVLLKVCGPKVIPDDILDGYNYIKFDTKVGKETRNFKWRRNRDLIGLSLRGTYFSVLPFLLLAYYNINFIYIGVLGWSIFPISYYLGYLIQNNREHFKTGPELGEFIFGNLWFYTILITTVLVK